MSTNVIELNDSNFQSEVQAGLILVDFWAPWCGPCKVQLPILKKVADEVPPQIKVAKINVDQAFETATKYGVQSIPTLMIFKDGKKINQFVGICQAELLLSALKEADMD